MDHEELRRRAVHACHQPDRQRRGCGPLLIVIVGRGRGIADGKPDILPERGAGSLRYQRAVKA